jgi:hypothetical protein
MLRDLHKMKTSVSEKLTSFDKRLLFVKKRIIEEDKKLLCIEKKFSSKMEQMNEIINFRKDLLSATQNLECNEDIVELVAGVYNNKLNRETSDNDMNKYHNCLFTTTDVIDDIIQNLNEIELDIELLKSKIKFFKKKFSNSPHYL